LIHPFFITWNGPVTFQNNNYAAIIKEMNERDNNNYIRCFGELPNYQYVWLGVLNDESKDSDVELDGDED
jgi:hypothetical protein